MSESTSANSRRGGGERPCSGRSAVGRRRPGGRQVPAGGGRRAQGAVRSLSRQRPQTPTSVRTSRPARRRPNRLSLGLPTRNGCAGLDLGGGGRTPVSRFRAGGRRRAVAALDEDLQRSGASSRAAISRRPAASWRTVNRSALAPDPQARRRPGRPWPSKNSPCHAHGGLPGRYPSCPSL